MVKGEPGSYSFQLEEGFVLGEAPDPWLTQHALIALPKKQGRSLSLATLCRIWVLECDISRGKRHLQENGFFSQILFLLPIFFWRTGTLFPAQFVKNRMSQVASGVRHFSAQCDLRS
jgi:hypothetical protein